MKTRVVLTTCVVFALGLASVANAQLKAGSPEETAYNKIDAEKGTDPKLALLLAFEKEFPQANATVMSNIYLMTMDAYSEKDNKPKIAEYGDKAIAKDPKNVSALLRVSRNYATERTNLPKALEYAEKAKEILLAMQKDPAPLGQSDDQYKQWLAANISSADQYAAYAKALQK